MKMRIQQPGLLRTPRTNYGWANAIADIGSALITKNAEDDEQRKQADWLGGLLGPMGQGQQSSSQIPASGNDQYSFSSDLSAKPQTGLLPKTTPDLSLTGDSQTFFPMNQPSQTAQQIPQTDASQSAMPQTANAQVSTQTTARQQPKGFDFSLPPSRNDAVSQFNSIMGQKMKEAVAMGIPAKEAYTYLMQTRDNAIAQQNDAWKQKQSLAIYDRLSQIDINSPEAKKMLMYASYHGIPIGKEAWETIKPYEMKHVNANDRIVFYDPRNVAPGSTIAMGVSPDAQLRADTSAANTNARIAAMGARGYGSRGGTEKLGKAEAWAQNFEINHLSRVNATIDAISSIPEEERTPAQKIALSSSLADRDKYWNISSGGEYGQAQGGQAMEQPQAAVQQEAPQDNGNADGAAWYDQTVRQLMASEGMSQEDAEQYLSEKINNGG